MRSSPPSRSRPRSRWGGRSWCASRPERPRPRSAGCRRNIRVLPVALAAFLALVAIGAVSHLLLTSTRRRRRDFAVLRALGLTRGGTRLVLNAQATVIGVSGLVLGLPL